MNIALTSQFAGVVQEQADLNRISRLTLVGAEYEENGVLSMNDRAIVRIFADMMARLGIPLSEDLGQARDCCHHLGSESFEVVNLAYGGRDFLKHQQPAEVVIFCNLPLDNPARPGPAFEQLPQWKEALGRSGAKIAWISGSDSFTPEDLQGADYICVKTGMDGQSFLMRLDYLKSLEEYAYWVDAPVGEMIGAYRQQGTRSFQVSLGRADPNGMDYSRPVIQPRQAQRHLSL